MQKDKNKKKINTKYARHGKTNTKTYMVWGAMMGRCHNPKSKYFNNYGGRGIAVCKRWHIFSNFLDDMGEAPSGMSLERINNNKGYSKSNCKWATRHEQSRNKRNNVLVFIYGKVLILKDACLLTGMKYETAKDRVWSGWDTLSAVTVPIKQPRPKWRKAI